MENNFLKKLNHSLILKLNLKNKKINEKFYLRHILNRNNEYVFYMNFKKVIYKKYF